MTLLTTVARPFLLLILLTLATVATHGMSDVEIRVRSGQFVYAPATILVSARIEKHKGNRQVCAILKDDSGYTAASCRPHVGLDAPLQVLFQPFRGVPAGDYAAIVMVERQVEETKDGVTTVTWEYPSGQQPVRVMSALGE